MVLRYKKTNLLKNMTFMCALVSNESTLYHRVSPASDHQLEGSNLRGALQCVAPLFPRESAVLRNLDLRDQGQRPGDGYAPKRALPQYWLWVLALCTHRLRCGAAQ